MPAQLRKPFALITIFVLFAGVDLGCSWAAHTNPAEHESIKAIITSPTCQLPCRISYPYTSPMYLKKVVYKISRVAEIV